MKRDDHVVPAVSIAVFLIALGLVLSYLGVREAIVFTGVGLLLFVVVGWIAARPMPSIRITSRSVNPPPPYGPDPNLIDFADRLREEAEDVEKPSREAR